ncbi:MAG TPA: T9SS type A sorting domain-containing protein [Prolixibacteraceae bacterium]|jgi:hypothetical protein
MRTKNTYFLLLLFCLGFSFSNYGQLSVDAGKDTTFCSGVEKLYLGKGVSIKNGVEPYSIAWECKVPKGSYSYYTASDLLNDTTVISPYFRGTVSPNQWINFIIHVTDSENKSAMDIIRVRFSQFYYLTGYPGVEIHKGDSLLLKYSSIGGGIEPLKFQWHPETGLSNPDSLVTWCKPDVTTLYDIVATDSCGCVSSPNAAYYVMVLPTGFNEIKNEAGNLLNIRQNGNGIYFNNPLKQEARMSIYSINGVTRYHLTIADDHLDIDHLLETKGIYLVKISVGELTGSGKYLKY